ncbi:MAG: hypothetical protein FADNKDHG_01439 [Holosporales bacterium]
MKKYVLVLSFFYGVIGYGSNSYEIQPPLTAEMQSLGLTPFPSRVQQIVDVYLVDDETWEKKLKEAKEKFELLKRQEQDGVDIRLLLPEYWNLAKDYDYGQANDELVHTFIGGEDCNVRFKSDTWSDFFSTGRPTRLCDMEFNRDSYKRNAVFYLEQIKTNGFEKFIPHYHYQQSRSPSGATDEHSSSRETTPPKDDHSSARDAEKLLRESNCDTVDSNVMEVLKICNQNGMTHKKISDKFGCSESLVQKFLSEKEPAHKLVTSVHEYYKNGGASLLELLEESEKQKKAVESTTWHFLDLFSWVSRKSTGSSRSSNESTPPHASFSFRATISPKGDERDECQPLLGSSTKYVQPKDGLRRRHVVVDNNNR